MVKQQLRSLARRCAQWVAPTVMDSIAEVPRLRERVAELEAEIQESRRLHRRVAEITDVVEEMLLPPARPDEDRLRARLDNYTDSQ